MCLLDEALLTWAAEGQSEKRECCVRNTKLQLHRGHYSHFGQDKFALLSPALSTPGELPFRPSSSHAGHPSQGVTSRGCTVAPLKLSLLQGGGGTWGRASGPWRFPSPGTKKHPSQHLLLELRAQMAFPPKTRLDHVYEDQVC